MCHLLTPTIPCSASYNVEIQATENLQVWINPTPTPPGTTFLPYFSWGGGFLSIEKKRKFKKETGCRNVHDISLDVDFMLKGVVLIWPKLIE